MRFIFLLTAFALTCSCNSGSSGDQFRVVNLTDKTVESVTSSEGEVLVKMLQPGSVTGGINIPESDGLVFNLSETGSNSVILGSETQRIDRFVEGFDYLAVVYLDSCFTFSRVDYTCVPKFETKEFQDLKYSASGDISALRIVFTGRKPLDQTSFVTVSGTDYELSRIETTVFSSGYISLSPGEQQVITSIRDQQLESFVELEAGEARTLFISETEAGELKFFFV